MSSRIISSTLLPFALGAVFGLLSPDVSGQGWIKGSVCPSDIPLDFHRCALEAAESFNPPRTADGHPDLGGDWILPGGQTGGAYEDLEAHGEELDAVGGAATEVWERFSDDIDTLIAKKPSGLQMCAHNYQKAQGEHIVAHIT